MQTTIGKSVPMTSEGQITLSSDIRDKLGFHAGATFNEVLVGNCVLLIPEEGVLSGVMEYAREAFRNAGSLPTDLISEIEKIKSELFESGYPVKSHARFVEAPAKKKRGQALKNNAKYGTNNKTKKKPSKAKTTVSKTKAGSKTKTASKAKTTASKTKKKSAAPRVSSSKKKSKKK
jgi:hypothetical protein